MNALDLRRSRLVELRNELRERLERLQRDRQRVEAPLSADFAEQAVQRENDEVVDEIDRATASDLEQVERAISRLEIGAGDICERCGKAIDERRLAALPAATVCQHCA